MEQSKSQEYMKKANKLIEETDGGLVVYIQDEGNGRKAVNALGKDAESPEEVVQLFRAAFMACAEMLKLKGGEEVARLGAENLLRTVTFMEEPKNVHKSYIVGGRRR